MVGGVADVGKRPGPRDLEIGGVPHARIVHGGGSIGFGPHASLNHKP
ncbi:hypothetical protein [Vulcanisaeta distributa]|nr:hypothetical protein [Vulcanisaeta distributa]